MTRIATPALVFTAFASPALAHTGDHLHMHPHDGAGWLTIVAALGVIALAGRLVLARVRGRK
ncbi:hypothetical protein P775_00235 [Puniceibacterium antarcticum]|uniref:Peptidase M23 n=1 Tax=Puniceibacterium antarcticum TaxID=1206336 RepID=A0A2G8RL16_9RHOB|nr:hypothetical protein [Puniceibacterium antarcticum]PIL22257.1 hypothetical protein P775_00235 [Puniceibacterium antarcticum]